MARGPYRRQDYDLLGQRTGQSHRRAYSPKLSTNLVGNRHRHPSAGGHDCPHQSQLLDTRKTLPGLRLAQKYAVLQGGGHNHRIGLYDGFFNQGKSYPCSWRISTAITRARGIAPATRLEIEVESLVELGLAIAGEPDWIMLDNFSLEELIKAVQLTPDSIKLEASGGILNLRPIAYEATALPTELFRQIAKNASLVVLHEYPSEIFDQYDPT